MNIEQKHEESTPVSNADLTGNPVAASPEDVKSNAATAASIAAELPSPSNAPATDANVESDDTERQMRRISRRSFLWGAVVVGGLFGGRHWLITRRAEDGIPWPFRRVLESNGELARDLFSSTRMAPEFPRSRVSPDRVNGDLGLSEDFDVAQWKLSVEGLDAGETQQFSLAQIKALPRREMTTELKCIEGWSTIVHWTGVRLRDFMAKYPPSTKSGDAPDVLKKPHDLPDYVGLATPDGAYYVGLDMESALHPQTLLCYAMNGKALTPEHGAPLRLVTPVKYGIKHIKRIGTITYSARRPADYWAEQGYDWYSGH